MSKPRSRILSLILAVALVIGGMITGAPSLGTVAYAATGDVNDGVTISTGDNYYFGNYNIKPILWRALEGGASPLLLSEDILERKAFRIVNIWADSSIRTYLNSTETGGFIAGLPDALKVEGVLTKTAIAEAGETTNDAVYLLSADEAGQLDSTFRSIGKLWWLRSAAVSGVRAVESTGNISTGGYSENGDAAIRPALKVSNPSAIFGQGAGTDGDPYTIGGGSSTTFDTESYLQFDVDSTPTKWKVIEKAANGTITILSVGSVASLPFRESTINPWNVWNESDIYSYLNDTTNPYISNDAEGSALQSTTDGKMFLLSTEQAESISYFNNQNDRIANYNGSPFDWWLRSAGDSGGRAAVVAGNGDVNSGGAYVGPDYGVRPAFKLNPSSVIFTSEIGGTGIGAMPADTTYSAAAGGAKNFKLTVLNNSIGSLYGVDTNGKTVGGGGFTLTGLSASQTGGDYTINYKIVQDDGDSRLRGYGSTAAGSNASLTVDTADLYDGYYCVYVWLQKNNDQSSHEATFPTCIILNVEGNNTLPPKTITVGTQNGSLKEGTAGSVTFPVTTQNIEDGRYTALLNGYNSGLDISTKDVIITDNRGTLTIDTTAGTFAGRHSMNLFMDNTNSNYFELVVNEVHIHSITVDPAITNGTVAVQGGVTQAEEGDTIRLTVTPDSGYILTPGSLKYNATPITGTSFVMPGDNVTISAGFEPVPATPSISNTAVSMPVNGTATFAVYLGSGSDKAESATVTSGSEAVAVATPAKIDSSPQTVTVTGKSVGTTTISLGWSGGTLDRQSTSVDVEVYAGASSSHTITAVAGTGGSISPSGSVAVDDGDDQAFTITPDANYQIADVLVDGVFNAGAVAGGSYTFTNVTANHTISVSFKDAGGGGQPTTHTINFYDGATLLHTKTVEEGKSLGADFPTDPGKADYRFDGWWTGQNGAGTQFTASTAVAGDLSVYAKWTYLGGYNGGYTGGGSSGSGSSGSTRKDTLTAAALAGPHWLTDAEIKEAVDKARQNGDAFALLRRSGSYGVKAGQWKLFGDLSLRADTTGSPVQVRVSIPEPAKLTADVLLSGAVKGRIVDSRKAFFEKWFQNQLRVVHLDYSGSFGQAVEIAARVDLTGMDTANLTFYSYDKAANSYKRIEKPAYWIDSNGYLHFTTELAGDIVVSEGGLEKR